jgi:hypothetical protein
MIYGRQLQMKLQKPRQTNLRRTWEQGRYKKDIYHAPSGSHTKLYLIRQHLDVFKYISTHLVFIYHLLTNVHIV